MNEQIIGMDLDGFDKITTALRELINQYPGLDVGEEIQFATLSEDGGIAMFPTNGAMIRREVESITGHVTQECLYPFFILYRTFGLSENKKANIKEWLDDFGRWLERQPIRVNNQDYVLKEYPLLTENRIIKKIQRQSPAYLDSVNENKSENWMINLLLTYSNEFDR